MIEKTVKLTCYFSDYGFDYKQGMTGNIAGVDSDFDDEFDYFIPHGDEYDGCMVGIEEHDLIENKDYFEIMTDLKLFIVYWNIYCGYHVNGHMPEIGVTANYIPLRFRPQQNQILNIEVEDFTPLMRSIFDAILEHYNQPKWEDDDDS